MISRRALAETAAAIASVAFVAWIGIAMSDLRRETNARTAAVEAQIAELPRVEAWATSLPEWVFTAVQAADGQTMDFHLVGPDLPMPQRVMLAMPPGAKPVRP